MTPPRTVRVHALAKINLTLRVIGRRDDGYHDLRTVFQSVALHDTLTVRAADGPFRIDCDDPSCPVDRTNLVWRAAESLWKAAGRRGRLRGVSVDLVKRIPSAAGLGGGSSDAAAALRALTALWDLPMNGEGLVRLAAGIGADVAFFLQGGTALGLERGDRLFPLADGPSMPVVIAMPPFGVSTREAYEWLDQRQTRQTRPAGRSAAGAVGPVNPVNPVNSVNTVPGWPVPAGEWGNDLEGPVTAHQPGVGRLVRALRRAGASYAAMSGSGSAVFGLFGTVSAAEAAATEVSRVGVRALVTRTLTARQARHASRLRTV